MGFWQLVSILSRLVSPQLTRIGLDHSPLLLLQNQTNSSTQKPFRYENMRHTHPLFENWAYTHWATLQGHLMDKLHVMSSSLSTWNRQTFGNLFSKLTRLSNHIQGIQASPSYHHSTFLHHLERDLLNQHAQKIHQVSVLGPASASKLAHSRSQDTHFFHLAAKILHRRNKIISIQDDQVRPLTNQSNIFDQFNSYFRCVPDHRPQPNLGRTHSH